MTDDLQHAVTPEHEPARRRSRFRGRDAVTTEERERPPAESSAAIAAEAAAHRAVPDQLALFTQLPDARHGRDTVVTDLPELHAGSSLTHARGWYRHHLERNRRPPNTIASYSYDLLVLENLIGPRPLNKITGSDIAKYLGEAANKTTRKRRLTSARRFFTWLIEEAKVLRFDPTEGYFPHTIQLRVPVPLFTDEQEALMEAARNDEAWSATAIWLMLRLALSRSELLALKRDHIDRTDPEAPIVYVFYDDLSKQAKERKLAATPEFAALYDAFLEARDPEDALFPIGRQAVNGMVERVRRAAGITKEVTPQTLRHTYAVEQAKAGADASQLLTLLGLADDPRNRASVARYIRLAEPALMAEPLPDGGQAPTGDDR
jgi:integrase/recombinase XerD